MLSAQMQRAIVQACVTVIKQDGARGRGVLVAGELVLTAAHCVDYTLEGGMALGDYFFQELQTTRGPFKTQPLAVEPVADIAVLGALDGQEFLEAVEAFETWCADTLPVPVCLEPVPVREWFPAYLYTHRETWLQGRAQLVREDAHALWFEFADQIEAGTSGSPIVTEKGEIIGIVSRSNFTPGQAGCQGVNPRPHLTVPGWVMHRILAR
jgi:hypothetical protein